MKQIKAYFRSQFVGTPAAGRNPVRIVGVYRDVSAYIAATFHLQSIADHCTSVCQLNSSWWSFDALKDTQERESTKGMPRSWSCCDVRSFTTSSKRRTAFTCGGTRKRRAWSSSRDGLTASVSAWRLTVHGRLGVIGMKSHLRSANPTVP